MAKTRETGDPDVQLRYPMQALVLEQLKLWSLSVSAKDSLFANNAKNFMVSDLKVCREKSLGDVYKSK